MLAGSPNKDTLPKPGIHISLDDAACEEYEEALLFPDLPAAMFYRRSLSWSAGGNTTIRAAG